MPHTKEPIKILYVHQDGGLTGSAISLRNLLLALDKDRYIPRVLLAGEGPARNLYEDINVPVDVVPIRPFWTFPGNHWYQLGYYYNWLALLPNRQLEDYLQRCSPDLVHINDKAMLSAGMSAHRVGVPVVWHLRSTYFISHSQIQAAVSRYLIRKTAYRLIAISEDESDGFEDLDSLRIIYNTVDFDLVKKSIQGRKVIRAEFWIQEDEFLVGWVSNTISESRGSWDFIRAAGLANQQAPGIKLRFIIVARIPGRGSGSLGIRESLGLVDTTHPEDKAFDLAREAKIDKQLILTGYRPDALAIMAAMDVVVLCNRRGVLGRMPLEAMAVGKPIVVTAGHSGRSRVVRDGETALVVPTGNIKTIANAILDLVHDSGLRHQMGQNGYKYAHKHFDPYKNAQAVQNVYEEVLNEQPI